ncbi:hypothetical protein Pcac1_g15091 [Phytophthora cactorum]|uniref:Uncharacterized protein n=1 Tax=Phytophthora cactorum TaxID=29920 RepID=A0A329RZ82_9STRA|nr:hypothetical protein Pcac1_g15091 [Phytophthora cactorum]KAG2907143.1 hypothetical protein PC114_g10907 [Phytophthora cactorum]KAG2914543.1 hypothetical protein PC115_g11661 [Phytophthora cactorum]KAG2934591.1 hypothetical protein PC117_g12611 [Phytophthora cactorum]KAG3011462.1 hypothetical protein PC119_g13221 [Phytophthora cactorum]
MRITSSSSALQVKAEKAAAHRKRKLARARQRSVDSTSELVKTIVVLCADADREDRARAETAEAKRPAERDARDKRR